ncbi:hypothetical protein [Paeniglutamicibacter sp. NPDC091659]|uniref:hypothetical protein n=1 Tax=Paeniglutamicibacter sp. NPDC091659 TaxID=3364389 RepID=UPI00380F6791
MTTEFIGGAWMPSVARVFPRGIRLKVSEEKLEFRLRYGLDRFFGPWFLEHSKVKLVFREPRGLNTYHTIGILVSNDVWWSFYTYRPEEVLDCLEEFGYPIDPNARRNR